MPNRFQKRVLVLLACIAGVFELHAEDVTLHWDRNPETNVISYIIFHGEAGQVPTITTSSANQAVIRNLVAGKTYFFFVKAVNILGLESDSSTQISYTSGSAPVGVQLNLPRRNESGAMVVSSTGTPQRRYEIQANNDLRNNIWTTLAVVTASLSGQIQFEDATQLKARFYRIFELN
jgi:hypothetical protein